jgi:hypothetical protein
MQPSAIAGEVAKITISLLDNLLTVVRFFRLLRASASADGPAGIIRMDFKALTRAGQRADDFR